MQMIEEDSRWSIDLNMNARSKHHHNAPKRHLHNASTNLSSSTLNMTMIKSTNTFKTHGRERGRSGDNFNEPSFRTHDQYQVRCKSMAIRSKGGLGRAKQVLTQELWWLVVPGF